MTTKITSIYDNVTSTLSGIFSTTHKELDDTYLIENNPDKTLVRGYGFRISSAVNTNRAIACFLSVQRDLEITLTIINRGTERDITIKKTAEKQLLEDHYLLIKEIEKNASLNSSVAKISYSSDGGIENVFGDDHNFLMIRTVFQFEYLENLN